MALFKDLQIILIIRLTDLEDRFKFFTIWLKFTLQLHNPLESSVYLPGSKIAHNPALIYLHAVPPEEVLPPSLLLQPALVLLKSHLFFNVSLWLLLLPPLSWPPISSCLCYSLGRELYHVKVHRSQKARAERALENTCLKGPQSSEEEMETPTMICSGTHSGRNRKCFREWLQTRGRNKTLRLHILFPTTHNQAIIDSDRELEQIYSLQRLRQRSSGVENLGHGRGQSRIPYWEESHWVRIRILSRIPHQQKYLKQKTESFLFLKTSLLKYNSFTIVC